MTAINRQPAWTAFYENAIPYFFREYGYVPTFEEFQQIVFANDYDLGETK